MQKKDYERYQSEGWIYSVELAGFVNSKTGEFRKTLNGPEVSLGTYELQGRLKAHKQLVKEQ